MIVTSEEMIEVFASIEDVESAEASGEKMQKLIDRLNEIGKKLNEVEEPTEEQIKALEAKYEERVEELQKKMQAEIMRIAMLGPEVQQAMQDNAPDMEEVEMPEWMK